LVSRKGSRYRREVRTAEELEKGIFMKTEGERRLIASSIGERRASQEDVILYAVVVLRLSGL